MYKNPKNLTPLWDSKPGSSILYVGGRDDHYATPPGQKNWMIKKSLLRTSSKQFSNLPRRIDPSSSESGVSFQGMVFKSAFNVLVVIRPKSEIQRKVLTMKKLFLAVVWFPARVTRDRCYDFKKIFSPKNLATKLSFLTKNKDKVC
jgi:hypothetical protein